MYDYGILPLSGSMQIQVRGLGSLVLAFCGDELATRTHGKPGDETMRSLPTL